MGSEGNFYTSKKNTTTGFLEGVTAKMTPPSNMRLPSSPTIPSIASNGKTYTATQATTAGNIDYKGSLLTLHGHGCE